MGFLDNILQSGQGRGDIEDFLSRFSGGQGGSFGADNISREEALSRYQQAAKHASPEVYRSSAEELFNQMSPEQRRELAQYMRQRANEEDPGFTDLNHDGIDDRLQDPRELAAMTQRLHERKPGFLSSLLGGESARRSTSDSGGMGSQLQNAMQSPVAKAALAGLAAIMMKKMMHGGDSRGIH